MDEQIGIVTRGINNIYTVVSLDDVSRLATARTYSCRIKGKVLQDVDDVYNPLAVGDQVLFNVHQGDEGMILKRLERRNSFERWNAKRGTNQTLVANMDLAVCVTSTDDPPFRPRFIDRAIVCAHDMPLMIVLNKCDLMLTEEQHERFQLYASLGYDTFAMSAFDEKGIEALHVLLRGKTIAMIGQSGVGKSTLVNALLGGPDVQKTGGISTKFHRGRHTTNHALMLASDGFNIVDTPGMRELLIPHEDPHRIAQSFPEFRKYADKCSFQPCLHDHEPGCAIKEQVEAGSIHPDRYESYLRMIASVEDRPESWESDRR
jgi:ribosome biogenesis GTPase